MIAQAMTILEQQYALGVETVESIVRRIHQLGAGTAGEPKSIFEQAHDADISHLVGEREQDDVQHAVHEHLVDTSGLVLAQQQPKLRVGLAEIRHELRQQEGCDGRNHAEAQRSREHLAAAMGDLHERFQIADAEPRLYGDVSTEPGHGDLSVGAVHQTYPEGRLELANGDAEGRLRHEAGIRGLSEVPVLVQGDEVSQLLDGRQIHGRRGMHN